MLLRLPHAGLAEWIGALARQILTAYVAARLEKLVVVQGLIATSFS
jgi:hypothetical protein